MISNLVRKVGRIPAKTMRWLHGPGGAVVNFHDVGEGNLYVKRLEITLSLAAFEERLAFLRERFEVVAFSKFRQARFRREAVALTFDDGYRSLLAALPVLECHRLPVKVYLNSHQVQGQLSWLNKLSAILERLPTAELPGFAAAALPNRAVENPALIAEYRRWYQHPTTLTAIDAAFAKLKDLPNPSGLYLSAADLKDLARHPLIEWGSHTEAHLPLEKLSPEEQRQAIVGCHDYLREILGPQLDGFALPFGGARLRQPALAKIVGELDTDLVTATGERIFYNKIGALPEIQRLPGDGSMEVYRRTLVPGKAG